MEYKPLTIFLAEDDEDDRQFFTDAIAQMKVKTKLKTFNDGQELMDHLSDIDQAEPDLVFLDLNMPRKSGMECLEEIRKNPRLKDLVIAIYSTSASEEDVEDTFVRGANIYIHKPNDFPALKKVLADVLSVNWQYHTSGLDKANFLMSI